jgi:valyl-tRNA synthetase
MLEKTYAPAEVEARHYKQWEEQGAFAAGRRKDARPYTIMMPPPNVTGSLHMGHALTFTLQDVLIRFYRLRGFDALWQPGTDHAGIATQMVVERQLEAMGSSRHALGREAFIERVWEWKAESGDTITRQLRRLGASPDWARQRFTMDEGLSSAVRKVFVDLHRQGLIYRDKRLVNWDPKLHTAISDLEVDQREVTGRMWYFRYPIEGEKDRFITVATTRPETMLGDTAVAVHPDDDRYKSIVGKFVLLPVASRRIPIVADTYSDPEKGTGAVKITPAHDFNDFEVGRRHNLPLVNIFDENARLNENAPESLRGLDRFEARERVVAEMERLGLVEKIEDNPMTLPYGDRSGVIIEPWLTDQWYVNAAELAKPAVAAVEDGRIKFVPKHWENTFFEWMRNIQPWCISRQIWWGHQIPAWYGPDRKVFVALSEDEALADAAKHYGVSVPLTRDSDVLDTWFSSALWPFSTLGWPEQTPELARYYPTDVLVTGFDIIFFWVARMMMMGLHFMKEVPFKTVYIHALVRDEKGQKMSKSKGNILDPVELIDEYGCDALRFTLAALAAPGRDIKLSPARVEGNRNFATKLWNAARFCEMNQCTPQPGFEPSKCSATVNRWIVGEVAALGADVTAALENYRFDEAANRIYHFVWGTFCDWYLEIIKPILLSNEPVRDETRGAAAWVLDQILHLLHPFMPFITEELWEKLSHLRATRLISAEWPSYDSALRDAHAEAEMNWLVKLVSDIRAARTEMNVPPATQLRLVIKDAKSVTSARVETHRETLTKLARLSEIAFDDSASAKGALQVVVDEATYILPLAGVLDVASEKQRLAKEIAKLKSEVAKLDAKLGNEGFLAKAPPEVVEEQRERRNDAAAAAARLDAALSRLAAM